MSDRRLRFTLGYSVHVRSDLHIVKMFQTPCVCTRSRLHLKETIHCDRRQYSLENITPTSQDQSNHCASSGDRLLPRVSATCGNLPMVNSQSVFCARYSMRGPDMYPQPRMRARLSLTAAVGYCVCVSVHKVCTLGQKPIALAVTAVLFWRESCQQTQTW